MEITETRANFKRARLNDSSVNHLILLKIAGEIWKKDLDKARSKKIENREFRATFGCGFNISVLLWEMLNEYNLVPEGGNIHHLMWVLMFIKNYGTETPMKYLAGGMMVKRFVSGILSSSNQLQIYHRYLYVT